MKKPAIHRLPRRLTMWAFRKRCLYTAEPWSHTVKRDPCCWCGRRVHHRKGPMTVEHVEPISSGGSTGDNNIVGAHRQCNNGRNTTPLLFVMQRRLRAAGGHAAKGVGNAGRGPVDSTDDAATSLSQV